MSNTEPIIRYLMEPDNMPDVLHIIEHAEELRQLIESRFWNELQKTLTHSYPLPAAADFSWKQRTTFNPKDKRQSIYDPPSWFYSGCEIFLEPHSENQQGLKYRIEVGYDWFGFGLTWYQEPQDEVTVEKLCQKATLQKLKYTIQKSRFGEVSCEPDSAWFVHEYLDKNPFQNNQEIWAWFEKHRNETWQKENALVFSEFIRQTYELLRIVNEDIKYIKA